MKHKLVAITALQVIRKSNELIEARYRLSVWEQRLILTLLMQVSAKDEDFKRYKIGISELAKLWNLGNNYTACYEDVQKAAESLVTKAIQISDDPSISKVVSWLAYVEYKHGSGEVEMEFHSELKPYLLQLKKHFTQYQISHTISFRNQYTIRVYELLKMEAFKAVEGTFSRHFSYAELRELLALEDKEYQMISDFKKRIIDPSVNEINLHTDLAIESVTYGKTGRKITDMTFVVRMLAESKTAAPVLPKGGKDHPVVSELIALGFSEETAKKYKKRYGVTRIKRNLDYVVAKQKEMKIKDVAAYLNQAIQEDLAEASVQSEAEKAKTRAEIDVACIAREQSLLLAHVQRLSEATGTPLEKLLSPEEIKLIKKKA
jgi:plasmid replication initiation protein